MEQKGGLSMLFRKKVDRYCAYCAYAGKVNNDQMICQKCGIVPATHHCRRFRYDPLKRVPARTKAQDFSQYDQKDYAL